MNLYQWIDPNPANSCSLCRYFTGYIFTDDNLLPLPAHPDCECIYDHAPDGSTPTEWNWDSVPPDIRGQWESYAQNLADAGNGIPTILQPLLPQPAITLPTNLSEILLESNSEPTTATGIPARFIRAGQTKPIRGYPRGIIIPPETLQFAEDAFNSIPIFLNHTNNQRDIRDLAGVTSNPHYDPINQCITGKIHPYTTNAGSELHQLIASLQRLKSSGIAEPNIGVSLDASFALRELPDGSVTAKQLVKLNSIDVVINPAADGRFLTHTHEELPAPMSNNTPNLPNAWLSTLYTETCNALLRNSDLPTPVIEKLKKNTYPNPSDLENAIKIERETLAQLTAQNIIQIGGTAPRSPNISLTSPLTYAEQAVNWLFGVPNTPLPEPILRRADLLYVALTGDTNFTGMFQSPNLQFAGATTTTLPNLAVNAMNKVILTITSQLVHWRWYESIVTVAPNDGSLQDMQWISPGGIANLPAVPEGGSYSELTVSDKKEADSWATYGGYVGISRKMLKNSDIQTIQMVPRNLAIAAIRTRSAAIAGIFTANSGVGPTLDQDSTALFHSNHSNVATTALGTDTTAWRAARTECYKHTEINSSKRLALYPKFLLVPADLFDVSLSILGYGDGQPTSYTPERLARNESDPRPVPLVVPDWTDTTDWAYIVDPLIQPVIMMSYSQNPSGSVHPSPELFTAMSETAGLMFTNDTLPIKVRDEWVYGVASYRGIGKRNVA